MSFSRILQLRGKYFPSSLYHSFLKPFQVEKANSCYYYAPNDPQPYLDLYNNVCHVGHSNPAVLEAVKEAYSTINIHTRYLHKNLTEYVQRLQGYLPPGFKVLFTNSGSEANDLAIQMAMRANKDKMIGSFEGSYHGTTWLCNQISHLTPTGVVDQKPAGINVKFFAPESSPNTLIQQPTCKSFILQTIQGVGGNVQISDQWLKTIRNQVDIMICDEVQTGFGRSGDTFWAWEKAEIIPDIITCGKPIANGYPMGAIIFKKELERFLPSTYFNTFGGNSAACLVANAVLTELQKNNLVENSRQMGALMKKQLEKLSPAITKVTGRGLYLGVHFAQDIKSREIVQKLKDRHVIVGIGYNDVLRIKPPITIQREDIMLFVQIMRQLLSDYPHNGMKRSKSEQQREELMNGTKRSKN